MMSRKTIAIIVFVAAIAAIPACESTQTPGVTPDQVTQIEQQLQQAREGLTTLPADDPGRIAAEEKIAELEKLVAAYKANRERQTADDPEASIAAGVQTVAPFLPPPWNAVLLIAGGLLPGVAGWIREAIRRSNAQQAGQDLARAIKAAAVANGGVLDFTDLTVRESLKAAMPDAARAIVKDAGANVPLPFVIEAPTSSGTAPLAGSSAPVAA
ncbi:MAG: hypothetical protein GC159_06955 [Phycisphaera sp.]|nr:hypothetical protein [Phycisphaera sp.]